MDNFLLRYTKLILTYLTIGNQITSIYDNYADMQDQKIDMDVQYQARKILVYPFQALFRNSIVLIWLFDKI